MMNAEARTIGYWSAFGGVEVKEILYDINDRLVCVSGAWNGQKKQHKLKIYYENRPYVRLYGTRLYLDECLRV